jgi:RNA polymerase sigma-70 factor (ECF subfamily)
MTPKTPNDADLLRLMTAGDEHAFTTIYRKYQGNIYRFALLMSGSTNIAEEVTQEVFLALIREPHRYDPTRGVVSAYLYGVARNQVRRVLKRESPYLPIDQESDVYSAERLLACDDPFTDFTRNEMIRLVRHAVLSLPARYREVVVLCDFQEVTCADAAAALGCAIGTINSRLHRGHSMLLKKLRVLTGTESPTTDASQARCFA